MTRLSAGELADIHRNAMAEYTEAAGFVVGLRDRPLFPGDPFAEDTRQRVTRLAQEIADVLEWRVEQVEDMARGIAAQEKAETAAHYAEQARLAAEIDRQPTFGGRPYDVPRCAHGCCPDAVCEFVGDCASHQAAS